GICMPEVITVHATSHEPLVVRTESYASAGHEGQLFDERLNFKIPYPNLNLPSRKGRCRHPATIRTDRHRPHARLGFETAKFLSRLCIKNANEAAVGHCEHTTIRRQANSKIVLTCGGTQIKWMAYVQRTALASLAKLNRPLFQSASASGV